jgi:hypothetical protein
VVHRDTERIARGYWLPEEHAAEVRARCAIALEACADDTVAAFTTAARIHDLWLPVVADELHLATAQPGRVSRGMTRTHRPEFRAHRRFLSESDRTVVDGIPVMSLERTWIDLAPLLSLPDLVAAGDSALRAGATIEGLADVIRRSRHLRGVRLARDAIPLLDARSRSRPESHLRVAATAPDLPRFEVNVPIYRDEGGWLAEPDLSLEDAKVALEYKGADHAELGRMRRDITRDVDMRRDRWLTLEYGPAEVFGRPWQIAPELRHVVRVRAPHLLRSRR